MKELVQIKLKNSWADNQWGIIDTQIEDNYFINLHGDTNTQIACKRNEFCKVTDSRISDMANLSKNRTKLSVNIWLDSLGASRKVNHNLPRVKIQKFTGNDNSSSNLIPVIITNGKAELTQPYTGDMNSKELNKVLDFLSAKSQIILKHWNGEIDDLEALQQLSK